MSLQRSPFVGSPGLKAWLGPRTCSTERLCNRSTDTEAEAPVVWGLMQRANSLEKTPILGKIQARRMGQQRMGGWHHGLGGPESEHTLEMMKNREAWCAAARGSQRVGHDFMTEQQQQVQLQPLQFPFTVESSYLRDMRIFLQLLFKWCGSF